MRGREREESEDNNSQDQNPHSNKISSTVSFFSKSRETNDESMTPILVNVNDATLFEKQLSHLGGKFTGSVIPTGKGTIITAQVPSKHHHTLLNNNPNIIANQSRLFVRLHPCVERDTILPVTPESQVHDDTNSTKETNGSRHL
jgi:hypothetical protein